jgi:hypothetical protein
MFMKKITVFIIALGLSLNFSNAKTGLHSNTSAYLNSSVKQSSDQSDDDDKAALKQRIKDLKKRKKDLRDQEQILNQKLRIQQLERQARNQEKRNKKKEADLD